MRTITDQTSIKEHYQQYLSDESRVTGGMIDALYFPQSTEEVISTVRACAERGTALVVSGGRTGVLAGAVPCKGESLLSLSELKKPITIGYRDGWYARVSAGVTLKELNAYLEAQKYSYDTCAAYEGTQPLWFPVNPTEDTAQCGGIVATNASGSRSFAYGSVRKWVRRISVVSAEGTLYNLERGQCRVHNGVLLLPDGRSIIVGDIAYPQGKATVGYYLSSDMDAIDLFIGSEGTLGIITEIDFKVIPKPRIVLSLMVFFKSDEGVDRFCTQLYHETGYRPQVLEYFDATAIRFIREKKVLSEDACAAVLIEYYTDSEEVRDCALARYDEMLREGEYEGVHTWAGWDKKTHHDMAVARHCVPESINRLISERKKVCPEIRKMASDTSVPMQTLVSYMAWMRCQLDEKGIEYCMFGHRGDGHIHVNLLPQNNEDVRAGEALLSTFAEEAVRRGGAVSGEHGIGRLKKEYLRIQYSSKALKKMYGVKQTLDPHNILNPGVMWG